MSTFWGEAQGRIDEKALTFVTEGPWRTVNERAVIDDKLYRRYIAALIAYERELEDRMRARMGLASQSSVTDWRAMVWRGSSCR